MNNFLLRALLCLAVSVPALARDLQPKPADPALEPYQGWLAPTPSAPVLKAGDRLAICGDSITEQKQYGVLLETYVTACLPELGVTCRQYGWSGEQAGGFLRRLTNDVLRFQPTVATTCYGMNDHRYVPYTDAIGAEYRQNLTGVVRAFQAAGARVVLGSPGTIDSVPHWVKTATGTKLDLNLSLNRLRNLGIEVAEEQRCGFADVYWPMLTAMHEGKRRHGENFKVAGKDGVHPGWAGQTIMAYAFLRGLGVDGEIGTLSLDLAANRATASAGHTAAFDQGVLTVTSSRWPFCAPAGNIDNDNTIAAGLALVPFHAELNRLTFRVTGLTGDKAAVAWGASTNTYTRAELERGVNLAADFPVNPFSAPFAKLQEAVRVKQAFETQQIKQRFRSPEAKADMEAVVKATEAERAPLAAAITAAFHPVTHTLRLLPAQP